MKSIFDLSGNSNWSYQEAIKYIEEIPKFTEKHPLSHTKAFLKKITGDENKMKIIHVAGTNGKGSVCAMLSNILVKAGRDTGLFTSPHLVTHNERIRINNEQINDDEFLAIFIKVKEIVDEMEKSGYSHPSYFEFLFLMAMYKFKVNNVEYVILETGLGGRLDATNSIENPIVTIITQVGLDHMEYLGDTVSQIANEKAGIIKKNVPVIYWAEDEIVRTVILRNANEKNAENVPVCKKDYKIIIKNDKSIDFSVGNGYYFNDTFKLPFISEYQVQNAMLVLASLEYIDREIAKEKELVFEALKSVRWEGRMEMICPGVFFDGAHNGPGIDEFVKTFQEYKCDGMKNILFSVVKDKDDDYMVSMIAKTDVDRIYITQLDSDRALSIDKIEKDFRDKSCDAQIVAEENVVTAFVRAIREKREHDVIFCVGSLYLIGELKKNIASGNIMIPESRGQIER